MNGYRVKLARLKMGYTLADVAEKTGFTTSYISQIERNLKQPSLAALRKIADCLECSEVWLFTGDTSNPSESDAGEKACSNGYVVRSNERAFITMPEIHTKYEIITPGVFNISDKPKITGLYVNLASGCWVTEGMISHKNLDESIFIIKGTMRAHVGESIYDLKAGDSLYIPEKVLHNYVNSGDSELIAIVYFSSLIY